MGAVRKAFENEGPRRRMWTNLPDCCRAASVREHRPEAEMQPVLADCGIRTCRKVARCREKKARENRGQAFRARTPGPKNK